MTRRIAALAAWLALGGTALAALYWVFLNTPESNTFTLAASVAVALAMLVAAAVFVNTAVLVAMWGAWRASLTAALGGVGWFAVAALPVVSAWWAVTYADAWVSRHSGEISAWFIARLGWGDITLLFQAQTWFSRWIRWVVVPVTSLSLLAGLLRAGGRALRSVGWVRRAWHWRTLAPASLVFVLLFALPWQLTMWRPDLPPTWLQPVAAAARLGLVAVLGVTGCAILVALAVRGEATHD